MKGKPLYIPPDLRKKYADLSSVSVAFVEVTPGIAEEWLENNTRNRSIRPRQVTYLTKSLRAEGGKFSTDCIAFREDGTLFNGQHRLTAIVETGVSVPCLVLFDVPDSTDEIEDHVAPRLARDLVLSKAPDLKNSQDKTTIPPVYWRLKSMGPDSTWKTVRWGGETYTKNQIANYVVENDARLAWALSLVHNRQADLMFSPRGTFAAAALVMADRHKAATEHFFHQLTTGEGLMAGSPILWLRAYMIKQNREKALKGTESMDPLPIRVAFLFLTWNAWLEGREIRKTPTIYKKDKKTGERKNIPWPTPKRPSPNYKPWK